MFYRKCGSLEIMEFKFPKNDDKYYWTNHVGRKMMFYGLSADRIKRVMRSPKRSEKGIAEGTIAVMSPYGRSREARQPGKPDWKGEVWVMYQALGKRGKGRRIIITAWRYPGVSPIRDEIPIPIDILEELKRDGIIESDN